MEEEPKPDMPKYEDVSKDLSKLGNFILGCLVVCFGVFLIAGYFGIILDKPDAPLWSFFLGLSFIPFGIWINNKSKKAEKAWKIISVPTIIIILIELFS